MKDSQCTHPPLINNDNVIGFNQCLCLPKTELNTKNSTKRQVCCRSVEFLGFNSIQKKKSESSKTLNREEYDVICGWPLCAPKVPVTLLRVPVTIWKNQKVPVTTAHDIFAHDIIKMPVTIFEKVRSLPQLSVGFVIYQYLLYDAVVTSGRRKRYS